MSNPFKFPKSVDEQFKQSPHLIASPHEQIGFAVVVDDERDGLEEDAVLGVGVLHLLRLGWLLRLVQDRLQALVEPRPHSGVLWRRVVLQQPQQLHREPGRGHEVVSVVLECSGDG